MSLIAFVPLKEHHLPIMLAWLQASHVKAWWDKDIDWTPALVSQKYGSYIRGYKLEQGIKKPIQAFIITVDDTKIGYIQLYNAHDCLREDGHRLDGLPHSLAAFDIFIGDSKYVGKGYGTALMKQFLKEYVDPQYEACLVDPEQTNVQAVRTYEKAGFVKLRNVGSSLWMAYSRD